MSDMKPQHIASTRILRHLASLAIDVSIAVGAFMLAYLTAYGYPAVLAVPSPFVKLAGFMAGALCAFYLFAPYRGSWRYVSIPDVVTITKASALAVAIYTIGAFLVARGEDVPRTVPVLTFVYLVMSLGGARLAYRLFAERIVALPGRPSSAPVARAVLLCGLSDKAEGFIRASRQRGGNVYAVVGILDDAHINKGRTVQGVAVLGSLANLDKVLARLARQGVAVTELVVTETSPSRRRLASIVERANEASLTVSRIPDITETSSITSTQLLEPRPIELGDLLERPEVEADIEGVGRLIAGQVVFATGAGGSIGSELCRQIATFGPCRLVVSDSSEYLLYKLDAELRDRHPGLEIVTRIVDVRDAERVRAVMTEVRPDLVFHAAALKHVPMMETNPLEAIKTNVLGTRNVADAALAAQVATFVMISTDKAVNPTSIMGATKRAAEAYCQALDIVSAHTRFKTVRFGNVLGSNGSVVPRFQEQIAAGGPVTVTHPDIVRYFMTIPEAVRLVLHASAHAIGNRTARGKIMVLDMGKPARIVDLAERLIQLAGYKPRVDIEIVFTGLRPGEKLFEELFDPSEVPDGRTEEGYVVASPRVMDRKLLNRTIGEIDHCADREDQSRALELLAHIVPEYSPLEPDTRPDGARHPATTVRTVPT